MLSVDSQSITITRPTEAGWNQAWTITNGQISSRAEKADGSLSFDTVLNSANGEYDLTAVRFMGETFSGSNIPQWMKDFYSEAGSSSASDSSAEVLAELTTKFEKINTFMTDGLGADVVALVDSAVRLEGNSLLLGYLVQRLYLGSIPTKWADIQLSGLLPELTAALSVLGQRITVVWAI
ncbi:hypothetical protein D3874_22070 [Oleomonas cavernae]|uniref:Uncharacterized protein n=2 Tax=Oleomonas cavernae TaxID=2320859 RepID=A0A418WH15_9PROT|nr:hypothetical protein D3874_22070 [Oleomonas cavernae]